MADDTDRLGMDKPRQDYRRLPPGVRLDETIASLDPEPVPDPDAVHNIDQHRALRDD